MMYKYSTYVKLYRKYHTGDISYKEYETLQKAFYIAKQIKIEEIEKRLCSLTQKELYPLFEHVFYARKSLIQKQKTLKLNGYTPITHVMTQLDDIYYQLTKLLDKTVEPN